MDLVTVTWSTDLYLQKLQAYSINKYVQDTCIHWVIIEDDIIPIHTWLSELAPFYTKHTLKIIHHSELTTDNKSIGWVRQQILKFKIVNYIQGDSYIILDSKNFFIKPVNLNSWPIDEGNGSSHYDQETDNGKWKTWIEHVHKKTGLPVPEEFWAPETPFVIKTKVARKMMELFSIEELFDNAYDPSEFILYRFLSQENKQRHYRLVYSCWPGSEFPTWEKLNEEFDNEHVRTFGLHKAFIKENLANFDLICYWLIQSGFDDQLVYDLRIHYAGNQESRIDFDNRKNAWSLQFSKPS
jgi:hypothetical protein